MTEVEWFKACDPTPLPEFVRGRASDRKLRLVWEELPVGATRAAIETNELFAGRRSVERLALPSPRYQSWAGYPNGRSTR